MDVDLSNFTMFNNCLHFILRNKYHRHYIEALVVHKTLVSIVILMSHNSNLNFHFGLIKTLHRADNLFFRTNIKDIKGYVKECLICQKFSSYKCTVSKHYFKLTILLFPRTLIWMNIMNPLPITDKWNKYIFSILDHFSRFLQTFRISNIKKETIINF